MTTEDVLLAARGMTCRFGGVVAVSEMSADVHEGELLGLIGPNGAGKTTFFNALTAFIQPQEGQVTFAGSDVTGWRRERLVRLGIARTFQISRAFARLSALDNVLVGRHVRRRARFVEDLLRLPRARAETRADREIAFELLCSFGLARYAGIPAASLSYGHLRLMEIARALATEPRLLLLDEPAAGLNQQESQQLRGHLLRLRDGGLTILLVEHDMELVMSSCDRLIVMDAGRRIAEGRPEEVQSQAAVIEAYLGETA